MAPDHPSPAAPPGTRQRLLLLVSALLFFGWIGWLAYEAFTAGKPVVLSRPQFLISTLDVIADVPDPSAAVTVKEVAWAAQGKDQWQGKALPVTNLEECRDHGWQGPGEYILPLVQAEDGFRVAPTPPSPGYPPRGGGHAGPPRIYPVTPQTRAQLDAIVRKK